MVATSLAQRVVIVSVDGLRPDGITSQGSAVLPNFYRFRNEGAFTDAAKTDPNYSNTLPNHVSMMTGREVVGAAGHNWTSNSTPPVGVTLHTNKGSYVSSIFDVVDAAGGTTSLYASKTKFSLFDASYPGKIDDYTKNSDTSVLVPGFTTNLLANQWDLSFLHLRDVDSAGHSSGWGSATYLNAIQTADAQLGQLFDVIENNAALADTTIILTSDHGGDGFDHDDASNPLNNTVPLYVWGPGAVAGADLYALNPSRTTIRAMEVGNLALDLLDLGPVPGSTANFSQTLVIPEPGSTTLLVCGVLLTVRRRR